MPDKPRLIEVAFPLKQTSLDSVHEKNVRHGHISTLHIWPARRPLAASRAALIATLLPDPGTKEERDKLLLKLGGRVVPKTKKGNDADGGASETLSEETEGGILHWGRENSPDLAWFRDRIREAYGGRAPRVLDPFAGGGAIPLEAMRLGCEVTANDLNPVAWFILKCTLEYPQKLAGQKLPLPDFALKSESFMQTYLKGARALKGKKLQKELESVQLGLFPLEDVDLAWHVRAWGTWVLDHARKDLERFYPVIEEKPTLTYLWARTVKCKSCRATVPLLKTRWLCKRKDGSKRILLTMRPNEDKTGVVFDVQTDVPLKGGNAGQKRAYDKQIGAGTMTKSGVTCPCCGIIMTMEDIRLEGKDGRLGSVMTAVVVNGPNSKAYRSPLEAERIAAESTGHELSELYQHVPFGLPEEPTPGPAGPHKKSSSLPLYGFYKWTDIFTSRQLYSIGTFIRFSRAAHEEISRLYPTEWVESLTAYLALALSRLTDRSSTICHWSTGYEKIQNTFSRFALPINWDYSEVNPLESSSGGYDGHIEWIAKVIEHCIGAENQASASHIRLGSATQSLEEGSIDVILTDPPYYDAIIYSDIMDFFYVWLRRVLNGLSEEMDQVFSRSLAPKWDNESNDGELVDEPGRHGWNVQKSKSIYEDGMFRAFQACFRSLNEDGRLVVVFGHKSPDAWETLASAIIRAGFVVDGSWPIQTEMSNRTRALSSAALSSSVWLVCRKRPETARPGWDNRVLEEMHENITLRLRDYWDAGIHGPDFVWAATGPALEAYSKHPVVKKADEPGAVMGVEEFLGHVRRMVVDFMVGQALTLEGAEVTSLDDVTTYYLLHRKDFGMNDAPASACILYALSCSLTDRALADQYDILSRGNALAEDEEGDEDAENEDVDTSEGSRSTVRLKPWQQRKRKTLGYEGIAGLPAPLIDQVHRLVHLWKAGDVVKVDEFLETKGLRRSALFAHLLQALIELASGEERALLESISNHIGSRGAAVPRPLPLFSETDTNE